MPSITLLASIAQAQGWRGDYVGWGWGWGGWLAMSLMMVVFWGAIIAFAVWAIRSTSHHHDTSSIAPADSAMELARERYARGEITEEEFQRIRRGLS